MRQYKEQVPVTWEASAELMGCVHHWVIDTPSGPVSWGSCKVCGERREFPNSVEKTLYWEDDVSLDQVSSGASFRPAGAAAHSDERVEE